MSAVANNDADLVAASLSGNRDAFGHIVSRYQSLICSLAYSATGSLGASEDLAQETFITAWKHLRHLRERNKLKAWLCGIARNRINNSLRRDGREPVHAAEPLEEAYDSASTEPLPHDQTISKEEEAILWRSLERIPEIYREPLVLFYREHQSVEAVATALELSEDAVKQRLSRGRKLLHEQVLAFVEGALERTNPSRAFTIGVLASLPLVLTTSAKAAAIGAAAAKGSMAAKSATGIGLLNAIISPLLGLVGPWLQYRILMESARTDEECTSIRLGFRRMVFLIVGFGVSLVALIVLGKPLVSTHPAWFAAALIGLVAALVFGALRFAFHAHRGFKEYWSTQVVLGQNIPTRMAWEYRSRLEWLGLPFIHIRLGKPTANWTPVKAWLAAGDTAFGLLFAFGGLAVAPVSVGGLAIGLMPWGGLGVGFFAVGGIALGCWAFGGFAIGWQAFGGCALGWHAAIGGLAIARDFALGGVAYAAQVNNEIATQFARANPYYRNMEIVSHYIGWLNLVWLIPLAVWWGKIKKLNGQCPGDDQAHS